MGGGAGSFAELDDIHFPARRWEAGRGVVALGFWDLCLERGWETKWDNNGLHEVLNSICERDMPGKEGVQTLATFVLERDILGRCLRSNYHKNGQQIIPYKAQHNIRTA